ncbi:MAG: hypothetical protein HY329_13260, partial [Chloroflexi bacterium]|nr:hypothetical protein [Chloroflexota bacterium]
MRSLGRIAPLTVVDLLGIDGFGPGALEHLRVRAEIWLTRQVVGVEDSTTAGPTAPLRPETQGLAALAFDLEPGNESSDPNSGELGNAADESLSCDLFGPLWRALDSLNERERLTVVQRYGLDGAGPRTLEEVGQTLGV